jgi:hypothetical protein
MDLPKSLKLGAYVSKKTLYKALKKDLRPQERVETLKKVGLSSHSVGKISITKAKEIVKDVQPELKNYVKGVRGGKEKTVSTQSIPTQNLLSAMVFEEESVGQKNEAGEVTKGSAEARFAAMKNRGRSDGFGRKITQHQQKAITDREAARTRNIEEIKSEHTIEAGQEDLSAWEGKPKADKGPVRPSFGHIAPATAKPGRPPVKSNTYDKSKTAFDMDIG